MIEGEIRMCYNIAILLSSFVSAQEMEAVQTQIGQNFTVEEVSK